MRYRITYRLSQWPHTATYEQSARSPNDAMTIALRRLKAVGLGGQDIISIEAELIPKKERQ